MRLRSRVIGLAALAAMAVGALAIMAGTATGAPTGAKVTVSNFAFSRSAVTVHKGDKVVWKFVEGKHNVKGKGFESPVQRDGKYKHVFKKVGTYNYKCTIHPDMKGVVTVTK